MPFVHIRITQEGTTAEAKAACIRAVTGAVAETLGKNPASTTVLIEEVPTDSWGVGGDTVAERRKRK